MTNAHDLVRYPDLPFPQTHPVALGAFAALFGRPYAAFATSRVLEIGCGGGVNLINMALSAPQAQFVGVDLAERPIALAREAALAAGVQNVRFRVQDILEMDASLGEFDYIIAHGVYAWVPPEVRKALMRIVGQLLSADGLAMISYNAFPGCRFRQAVRELLLDVVGDVSDPAEKVALARAALADHIALWTQSDPIQQAMIYTARRMIDQPAEVLFHDELGAFYAPQLLSTVIGAARREGLSYLCDAQPQFCAEAFFPSEKFAALKAKAAGDWGKFEQSMDFIDICAFRSSIFCRGGGIDASRDAARLRGLWACGDLTRAEPDANEPDGIVFRTDEGAKIATNNPKLAQFLGDLCAAFPQSLSLDAAAGDPSLVSYVLTLFVANVVRITTAPLAFASKAGPRPLASPLARFQAARGEKSLACLNHYSHECEDPKTLAFLALLDGARTREDLAAALALETGANGQDATNEVTARLAALARLGLIAA